MVLTTAPSARWLIKEAACYPETDPVVMEPVMKVAVEVPTEFQGAVISSVNRRKVRPAPGPAGPAQGERTGRKRGAEPGRGSSIATAER